MNWDKIKKEYETTKSSLSSLAKKYGVKLGTLKSRKSREGWERNATEKDATRDKKDATIEEDATFTPVIKNNDLNEKQKLFCLHYIKSYNATTSYMKAYGVSRRTADGNAYRLMGHNGIRKEIERLKEERHRSLFVDAQSVLQKYIDIAFADITDYVTFGTKTIKNEKTKKTYTVNYVDLKDSSEIDGSLITEVKQGKDGVTIKLADKMKALEVLTKYIDLLSDNEKKRLQEEKLKVDIDKAKAEVDRLNDNETGEEFEVIIKRKEVE